MAKVIINITDNNETIVTYDNGKLIYPIFEVDEGKFNISDITDPSILVLISNLIHQLGNSFRFQLVKQGFVNKALNKSSDNK